MIFRSLTPRTGVPVWSSYITYGVNQEVNSSGLFYRCILANTNQQPPNSTYWVSIPEVSARDWIFGHGKADFLNKQPAIALAIETALQIFRSEVFWNVNFGVDWWNLLGASGRDRVAQTIQVQAREVILGVPGVTAITSIEVEINSTRQVIISYSVSTDYSNITNFSIITL